MSHIAYGLGDIAAPKTYWGSNPQESPRISEQCKCHHGKLAHADETGQCAGQRGRWWDEAAGQWVEQDYAKNGLLCLCEGFQ